MASPSLETLLETLAASDVEFIVVGLLAAVAQGAPVTTHDFDIVHRRTPDNVARLVDVLVNKLDARYRGRADVLRPTTDILAGAGHSLQQTQVHSTSSARSKEGGLRRVVDERASDRDLGSRRARPRPRRAYRAQARLDATQRSDGSAAPRGNAPTTRQVIFSFPTSAV
jgi:hypothetical protein